ncbi:hypothetical protein C2E23DRAFT_727589 [Lenzites betulinus]|nr:hypothetical protein C2E23DRAFT_727589 [Lenzites betulinus]
MPAIPESDIILSIPIYIQLPPALGDAVNRHILVSIRLLAVDNDSVRIESAHTILDMAGDYPLGPTGIMAPRRQGVQLFMPRDPLTMPLYVLISRVNRLGTKYHISVAISIREWTPGELDVEVECLRVRDRNVRRSAPIRVVHFTNLASAGPSAVNEGREGLDDQELQRADSANLI